VAAANQDSTEMKPATSEDGNRKQMIVSNPQPKRNVRTSSKIRKVDQTSDKVVHATANSGKTRPKRCSRRLVNYDESDDQSACTKESNDESSERRTRGRKSKKTSKRKSRKTSQMSETAVDRRYVIPRLHDEANFEANIFNIYMHDVL